MKCFYVCRLVVMKTNDKTKLWIWITHAHTQSETTFGQQSAHEQVANTRRGKALPVDTVASAQSLSLMRYAYHGQIRSTLLQPFYLELPFPPPHLLLSAVISQAD